ncbi:class I adenylate-forming enzyme family protein [Patulibacter defluvii]|uniref:class I adenylate-forming enzyme family protein n=1 Tax=Patulibacter defluvii TaxID=3095358 RepID=UPI002A7540E3|nr:AMP-binding protein [Patulibacter sp. DM4]
MPTIPGTLRAAAGRTPERDALRCGERVRRYRELDADVDRAVAVLQARGVTKGDRVGLMAPNSDGFVVAFYAALRAGAIVVPINPALARPELVHVLRDAGARAVVTAPETADGVAAAIAELEAPVATLALGTVAGLPDLLSADAGPPTAVALAEDDDALILYTSGTTGLPKGVLMDHHRLIWVGVGAIALGELRDGDRLLHVAPLYHAAQLALMLISGTMVCATHVVLPGFDPPRVLDALERHRITSFFGVPTMFELLLRQPDLGDRDLSAMRMAMFGAAPMPGATVERLLSALPGMRLLQFCGQTEAGPGGIYSTFDDVRARPEASGRWPLLNGEARVVDGDGHEVEDGGVGELLLRGETVMKGYWRNPEATAETIRDGWLHTGDLARRDADGFVTLVDRLKDMVITGGRNVYSLEVENAIAAHPDVAECAVVGRPHETYGESIVAVVGLRPGASLDLDGLRAFCGERIAGYKLPHALVVGAIPRNASGKVLKRELRACVAETAVR